MRIFLDANILFSAANEQSQLQRLITHLKQSHTLVTSNYAQTEAIRNIRAKRSAWEFGYTEVMAGIEIVESIDRELSVDIVAKDRPILATAIHTKCDYLITGDKRDFGHLFQQAIEGVTVLTPLMLIEKLLRGNSISN
jgi:predicted nucleic acid-binding protein